MDNFLRLFLAILSDMKLNNDIVFLDILNSTDSFDYGFLKINNTNSQKSYYFTYTFNISHQLSNHICEYMNYDSIHSLTILCKSDEIIKEAIRIKPIDVGKFDSKLIKFRK